MYTHACTHNYTLNYERIYACVYVNDFNKILVNETSGSFLSDIISITKFTIEFFQAYIQIFIYGIN